MPMDPVPPSGIDVIVHQPLLGSRRRLAFVTNDAAFTSGSIPSRVALLRSGKSVTLLFSPEHGLSARGADGARQTDGKDPLTGLPVISLYGEQWEPTYEQLRKVDAVLFDIPDIGCRYYTYLWTMTHVMEACAAYRIPLIIADRRNPIGIDLYKAEGPWLDEDHCASFIGRWNIPLKHACTIGELARYFNVTRSLDLDLTVIPVPDYHRGPAQLGDVFRPTSPAITTLQAALCYPGTGLLEGVNIHEGRGTGRPFTRIGAPWLDTNFLLQLMDPNSLSGLKAQVSEFTPTTGPYSGVSCRGIDLAVTHPASFMAVRFGMELLRTLYRIHPDRLEQRPYPTHANPSGQSHLDRLTGVPDSFDSLVKGSGDLPLDVTGWQSKIKPFLLYSGQDI